MTVYKHRHSIFIPFRSIKNKAKDGGQPVQYTMPTLRPSLHNQQADWLFLFKQQLGLALPELSFMFQSVPVLINFSAQTKCLRPPSLSKVDFSILSL